MKRATQLRLTRFLAASACASLVSGCLTLRRGDVQLIKVDSVPPGAVVAISPAGRTIETPTTIGLPRNNSQTLRFEKQVTTQAEGWLYLAAILDLFSRRVVGFAMSDTITRELPLAALRQALIHRPETRDLIFHSDRGSQYASHDYRRALETAGITCSMSRRGDCWDNAVVESFFGTLKAELMQERDFATRIDAIASITECIEGFSNPRRRHSSLGYVSPLMFELQHATGRLAA